MACIFPTNAIVRRWPVLLAVVVAVLSGLPRHASATQAPGKTAASDADELATAKGTLNGAQEELQAAQAAAKAARTQLDDFLASHFEAAQQLEIPLPVAEEPAPPADPAVAALRIQLNDLRAKREQLLTTLTEAHPEVVDVGGQIQEVETRLAQLDASSSSTAGHEHLRSALRQQQQKNQAAAAEYQRLLQVWQRAELACDAARHQVTLAEEHVATLQLAATPAEADSKFESARGAIAAAEILPSEKAGPVADSSTPTGTSTAAAPTMVVVRHSGNGETLALASLAVALAIAGLAAVRLARTSSNPLFTTADEASAALAVPIVGLVPATAPRGAMPALPAPGLGRTAGRIALAVFVFLVVAYAIKHADAISAFVADPVPDLRALFGL